MTRTQHWHQPHACAPVPPGALKGILAQLRPGNLVLVRPEYVARLSTAARQMGVRITRARTLAPSHWVMPEGSRTMYRVELVARPCVIPMSHE